MADNINWIISDPTNAIIGGLVMCFTYMYFANDFFCVLIGLFFPVYNLLQHPETNDIVTLKYLAVYSHIEGISQILSWAGISFPHFKLLLIVGTQYLANNFKNSFTELYRNIIEYDIVVIEMGKKMGKKIWKEYCRIKTNMVEKNIS